MTETDATRNDQPRRQPDRTARIRRFIETHAIAIAATAMVTISALRLLVVQA